MCFPEMHMQQIRDNMQYFLQVFQCPRSHQTLSDSETEQNSDADGDEDVWIYIFIEGTIYMILIR